MNFDSIITILSNNPLYLILFVALLCICIFALIKSLYKLFTASLFIIIIYFIYLDINNDPNYEDAKHKAIKKVEETIKNTNLEEVKDKVPGLLEESKDLIKQGIKKIESNKNNENE